MNLPKAYNALKAKTEALGFTMPSDVMLGNFLRTLTASKLKGNFLELGTGTGLSLSWIIDGMCTDSSIISIENDESLLKVAASFFNDEKQVQLLCQDAEEWLQTYTGQAFDLIFADTWAGKYVHLEKALNLVNPGGFYIVDDMNEQENWPEGHAEKAARLEDTLQRRKDFHFTRLDWSTGILLMTKRS